ncbi:hypothetical protein ACQPYK_16180 [Streptosporangium sp. CA-135522]|uniref:hypothetical protein n=1 Tax=Streptosporangium sp. CA-135522 TaxID=3240072 RepID=UPI003D91D09A
MNDRPDRNEDRLVYKNEDDLNVPLQRADETTAGFQESRHAETFPNRHDGLDDGRHRALDDDAPTVIANRPDDMPDRDQAVVPADRSDLAHDTAAHDTAAHAADGFLFDQDPDEVRRRWQEVQTAFVDDPRDSVERADSLVAEVTTALRTALESRTADLQGRWKNSDHNDTEQLRTALRDYRATLEQLLALIHGTR